MATLVEHEFLRNLDDSASTNDGAYTGVEFVRSNLIESVWDAYFDGSTATANSGLQLSSQTQVLMVAWCKFGDTAGIVFGQHDGASSGLALELQKGTGPFTRTVRAKLNGSNSTSYTVRANNYYCCMLSYDTGSLEFWIAGFNKTPVLVDTVSATVTWPASDITFGSYSGGGSKSECWIANFVCRDQDASLRDIDAAVVADNYPLPASGLLGDADPTTSESFTTDTTATQGTSYHQDLTTYTVISYDSANEAFDIDGTSGGNRQGHFIMDQVFSASNRWTFEAEIYFESDPANRDHIGVGFCMAASALPYYRHAPLDRGAFYITRFNTASTSASNPTYTSYDSSTFQNGETRLLRLTYDGTSGTQADVKLYFDNVLNLDWTQTLDTFSTIPMFHYYNAKIQINQWRYWADAVVTPPDSDPPSKQSFPIPAINSNSGDGYNRNDAAGKQRITDGYCGRVVNGHPKDDINNDYNKNWIDPIIKPSLRPPMDQQKSVYIDTRFGSASQNGNLVGIEPVNSRKGKIYGTITDDSLTPLSRRVRILSRYTGEVVREGWSNASGYYEFHDLDTDQLFTVIAYDYTDTFNAVVQDDVSPEPMVT